MIVRGLVQLAAVAVGMAGVSLLPDRPPCGGPVVASCECNDKPPFTIFTTPIPTARDIPRLAAQLMDAAEAKRLGAARELGRIPGNDVVEPLLGALGDRSCIVAAEAAWSLRGRSDPRAAEPLRRAMLHGGCLLRARATEVIGTFGGAENVGVVLQALRDPDPRVRAPAARALGELGDRQAVEPLITALRDDDKHVRQGAAESLGRLRDARALPGLTRALSDTSKAVRQMAADAIGRLGRSPR